MCVCVCVCVCVYTDTHTHTHTHMNTYTHTLKLSLTQTHTHTHTLVRKRTHTNAHVCVCVYKAPTASIEASPPAASCASAGDRRPRESPVLSASAMALRYRSKPDRAAHAMSHLTAHPTTPIDFPLVHASQCSRSQAVRFVPHSPVETPAHAASAHVLRCTNLLSGEVHET